MYERRERWFSDRTRGDTFTRQLCTWHPCHVEPMHGTQYKAKQVGSQQYLQQLIAYVHLNPVKAGIVNRPRMYRWSGHRDVLGLRKKPILAVDDLLSVYGTSRRQALRGYRSALHDVSRAEWSEEGPGKLPWWRLGRPAQERILHPKGHVMVDELGRPTSPFRKRYDAGTWIEVTCRQLKVEPGDLSSRRRHPEIIRVRDLVGLVGVERYGVKVKDLAAQLGKSEDGVSLWVRRGARRRAEDPGFAAEAEELDNVFKEQR